MDRQEAQEEEWDWIGLDNEEDMQKTEDGLGEYMASEEASDEEQNKRLVEKTFMVDECVFE